MVDGGFTSGSLFRKQLFICRACGLLCWGGKQFESLEKLQVISEDLTGGTDFSS